MSRILSEIQVSRLIFKKKKFPLSPPVSFSRLFSKESLFFFKSCFLTQKNPQHVLS